MSKIYEKIYFSGKLVNSSEASLHVASSAVLYGLSVYTVFPINKIDEEYYVFRIREHLKRLQNSAKLIGISLPEECKNLEQFIEVIKKLKEVNSINESVFVRATIHVDELIPGTKSKGMSTCLSVFLYEAKSIIPQSGAKLKVSPWRRNPDFCIPSRAKVNGAYINSVLAKQDAIDSGYDDAIFLDMNGHVCELSAANIFLVRDDVLITPGNSADILEGINRLTVMEIAKKENINVVEREVDMTELYIADEVFACGTSAYISSVVNIDGRIIGNGDKGRITELLKTKMSKLQEGVAKEYKHLLTKL